MPYELKLATQTRGLAAIVRLGGTLDLYGAPELDREVDRLLRSGKAREILLDLRGIVFMDSLGLRSLVRAHRTAHRAGVPLWIVRGGPAVSQVLRIVDGPIAPLACISRTAYRRCPDCSDEAQCGVRRMFAETYSATLQMMEETTLADAFRSESLAASPADPARTPPAQHGKLIPAE